MNNLFNQQHYLVRKKMLSLLGHHFHVFDNQGNVIMFSKMKAFKLKEDIRIYTNEDMREELIIISARSIIDFGATYDVFDAKTRERVGSLKRQGLKSIVRDKWLIFDGYGHEIGFIKEDSMFLSLVRRMVLSIIPQSYDVLINGIQVARFKQNFNPFVTKLNLDFSPDVYNYFDKRLGLAAGILLCAIEGKQED